MTSKPTPKSRNLESYIKREQPAPQPKDDRSIHAAIEREAAKRRNGGGADD